MSVVCAACGGHLSPNRIEVYAGPPVVGGEIHPCTLCSTGQVVPMPTAHALAALYSKDYYAGYAEGSGMAGGDERVPAYLDRRLERLESLTTGRRLLDLGSGIGVFVSHARSRGWDAIGLETSRWAATEGARRFAIRIVSEPLEDAGLVGSFDVIHANHVLEHLPDPVVTLRAALRALRPGGLFMAEVPQELREPFATALRRRVRPDVSSAKNFHLLFFSRRGLDVALTRSGFVVERLVNTAHPEALSPPMALVRWAILIVEKAVDRAPVFEVTARRPMT